MKKILYNQFIALNILIIISVFYPAINIHAQSLTSVLDYYPAPGQFINVEGIGTPEAGWSLEKEEGGLVSLGGYGGFITFKLKEPIINHPDNPFGVDFVIFGNAAKEFSEPAAILVMKDENSNGKADDTWYEIAGSDHFYSSKIKDYRITYQEASLNGKGDISWSDNQDQSGFIFINTYHTQNYYPSENFDPEFYTGHCVFEGTLIKAKKDLSNPGQVKSIPRMFGYADNRAVADPYSTKPDNPYSIEIEGMGGDAVDISWAMNKNNEYVELDQIDFIRLYNCVNDHFGTLGEFSPEIRKIIDIHPSEAEPYENQLLLIEDLPAEISAGVYQLNARYFVDGRIINAEISDWLVEEGNAEINAEGLLSINSAGYLKVSVHYKGLTATMETTAVKPVNYTDVFQESLIKVFPNPFQSSFHVEGKEIQSVQLYDTSGRSLYKQEIINGRGIINPGNLLQGVYLLEIQTKTKTEVIRIFRN